MVQRALDFALPKLHRIFGDMFPVILITQDLDMDYMFSKFLEEFRCLEKGIANRNKHLKSDCLDIVTVCPGCDNFVSLGCYNIPGMPRLKTDNARKCDDCKE